jgi:broad specificity phosphatase PhoE
MRYLYHCTPADRIPGIQREGLRPSEDTNWGGDLGTGSLGKVFFSSTLKDAWYFGEIIFRHDLETWGTIPAYQPVILRVGAPSLRDARNGGDANEFFVERAVPPEHIEVFWHGWRPMASAGPGWEDMAYTFDEGKGVIMDWEGTPLGGVKEAIGEARRTAFSTHRRTASGEGKPTVYFGRHGHTPYNTTTGDSLDSRIRGWANVPLDEEGKREAREDAKKFKSLDVKEIYSSDLDRAAETAREVAKATGAALYLIPNLRPWDLGEWSGDYVRDHEGEMLALQQGMEEAPPGGRPYREFYDRAVKIVHWLQERAKKVFEETGGSVAAFSHSRLQLALPCILTDGDPRKIPQGGGPSPGQVVEIRLEDKNWALRSLDDDAVDERIQEAEGGKDGEDRDYPTHKRGVGLLGSLVAETKRGTAMGMEAKDLTADLAKTARVLCEEDHPNPDQELQAIVGDPDDVRTSTFAQFKPNPGTLQLPNPLSPIEGDEIFFAYMLPGAVFQAHDGSEWNILYYDGGGKIQIENRWYPRISWFVSIGDIRRSIHQWIEPITQTVPPPPPGVDYSALPVKIMDKETNVGDIDQVTDTRLGQGSSW